MFSIGEKICYPMYGIGVIEGIEERTVLGVTAEYYVLRFNVNRVSAMVPVSTAQRTGLRRLITRAEGERVIEYIKSNSSDMEMQMENWNQRYRENCARLKNGNIFTTAEVYMCLKARLIKKGLSSGEMRMLALSRRLIADELSAVGIGEKDISGALN